MKSLHVNGILEYTGTLVNSSDYVRLMIVYDKQTNTAVPGAAQLLSDYATAGGVTTNSYSGLNMTNRERFIVLMDERIYLPPTVATQSANFGQGDPVSTTFKINRFIKLRDLTTMYNQVNGGTVADIQTGGLLFMNFGTLGTGANGFAFVGSFRLKYDDV